MLKDILKSAGVSSDARWINFNGNDTAAYHKAPRFIRELEIHEIGDDIIVAYEMNGEDLPFLNGYPVRLVIPGAYADSWVKMLSNITVTKAYKSLYYMDTAYRIPDNECECETEDDLFENLLGNWKILWIDVKTLLIIRKSVYRNVMDINSNILSPHLFEK